jgi:hypothetical protein
MLYISYGGFPSGTGHLLEFSLYRRKIVYSRGYPFGIDSFDISHDGQLIFMPTGENTSGDTWHVLAATTGTVVGAIAAGRAPHDTVVGANGQHVFLGGASARDLYEADATRPWKIVGRVGPLEPVKAGSTTPCARASKGRARTSTRARTGRAIGSTSYLTLRPEHRGLEIGWTWLNPAAWRTGANAEACSDKARLSPGRRRRSQADRWGAQRSPELGLPSLRR